MDIIVFDHLSDNSDNNENKAKHWLDMFLFHLIFLLYLFLALIKKKNWTPFLQSTIGLFCTVTF